jgi:hypothetical protein
MWQRAARPCCGAGLPAARLLAGLPLSSPARLRPGCYFGKKESFWLSVSFGSLNISLMLTYTFFSYYGFGAIPAIHSSGFSASATLFPPDYLQASGLT